MNELIILSSDARLADLMTKDVLIVTPKNLREFVAKLPRFRHHFREMFTPEFPFLPAQLELMANVLEAAASGLNEAIPMLTTAEVLVAMVQVTGGERFPNSRAEFHDDAVMVSKVIHRNRSALQRFAGTKGVLWTNIEPNPVLE